MTRESVWRAVAAGLLLAPALLTLVGLIIGLEGELPAVDEPPRWLETLFWLMPFLFILSVVAPFVALAAGMKRLTRVCATLCLGNILFGAVAFFAKL